MPAHRKPPTQSVRLRSETVLLAQADGASLGGIETVEVFEAMRRVWFSLPEQTRRAILGGADPRKAMSRP